MYYYNCVNLTGKLLIVGALGHSISRMHKPHHILHFGISAAEHAHTHMLVRRVNQTFLSNICLQYCKSDFFSKPTHPTASFLAARLPEVTALLIAGAFALNDPSPARYSSKSVLITQQISASAPKTTLYDSYAPFL